MTKKDKVKEFILKISRGLLVVGDADAQTIVDMCRAGTEKETCYAKLNEWDGNNGRYRLIRTIPCTQEQIDRAIKQALEDGPVKMFYWFELYNAENKFEGSIYTIDQFIFLKL